VSDALRLAVATDAETLERIEPPLAERAIEAAHLPVSERPLSIDTGLERFDVGFVFPSRLPEGGVLDALLGVPWVNGRETVQRSRYKAESLARLVTADVPIPETTMISNQVGDATLTDVWETFDPPVVVKPNSTTRGTGVAKCHDVDSFLGVCDYLSLVHDYRATGDRSFLVQEYLPDARDYRVMCIEGQAVGAVERRLSAPARASGRWKHNVHRGAEATGVELPAALGELAERAAHAIEADWVGVDLLVTDERAVVCETNARPTVDSADKYETGFYDRLARLIRQTAADAP
jgi:ribosomal protein S6--L-glutamate ligase